MYNVPVLTLKHFHSIWCCNEAYTGHFNVALPSTVKCVELKNHIQMQLTVNTLYEYTWSGRHQPDDPGVGILGVKLKFLHLLYIYCSQNSYNFSSSSYSVPIHVPETCIHVCTYPNTTILECYCGMWNHLVCVPLVLSSTHCIVWWRFKQLCKCVIPVFEVAEWPVQVYHEN